MFSRPSPTLLGNRRRFLLTGVVRVLDLCVKLMPTVALFSALFVLDGDLRWIGLLGVAPLFFALQKSCPSCSLRQTRRTDGWSSWPGH